MQFRTLDMSVNEAYLFASVLTSTARSPEQRAKPNSVNAHSANYRVSGQHVAVHFANCADTLVLYSIEISAAFRHLKALKAYLKNVHS